jgi:hypothetical protein
MCAIRSFVEIFVKICEYRDCEDDVDKDMTIELINQFGNVGGDPAIVFCASSIVYSTVVINGGAGGKRLGKTVDAFIPLATATDFSGKMVFGVCHEFADFRLQCRIVGRQFCFDDSVNVLNGELRSNLERK